MPVERGTRPIRVLLTNNTLAHRAGSELYVRDLAIALVRLGHLPVAYSPVLGSVARELERETIPVIDDLDNLGAPPDIIHGQHHHETMTAGLYYPDRPIIYVCHGWLPWEERPPLFPSIRRYVAVDDLCRERLLTTGGLKESEVSTIYNFADADRFKQRSQLPPKPKNALVFSNYASVVPDEIRAACQSVGVERVDIVGSGAGTAIANPEDILPRYDIVFATARSAIEAMVCGCAVVVADYTRMAGLVTSSNLGQLRKYNFGIRTLQEPVTLDGMRQALELYDAIDARKVSDWMRANATLKDAADRYVSIYTEVMEDWDHRQAVPSDETLHSAARYLRWLSPPIKDRHVALHRAERLRIDLDARREAEKVSSAHAEELRIELEVRREAEKVSSARAEELRIELEVGREAEKASSARLLSLEQQLASIERSRAWRAVRTYGRLKRMIWTR